MVLDHLYALTLPQRNLCQEELLANMLGFWLIYMDMTQPVRYSLLVERKDFAFYVELDYENLPDYCNKCRIIGHHIDYCRKWYPDVR